MSLESLDTDGDPLQVPLLSVVTKPSKRRGREEEEGPFKESQTFWRESLIATLCCFPFGLIALFSSLEVIRCNGEHNYHKARRASLVTERLVKFTYRLSAVLYVTLGLLLLGLLEAGIVVGIDKAHTSKDD